MPHDPKPRPNHKVYLDVLRRMTDAEKLDKVFELSNFSKQLFLIGLRDLYPDATDREIHALYLERLQLCHNRNY